MTATMQRESEQTLEADEEDFGPQSISKLEVCVENAPTQIYVFLFCHNSYTMNFKN